MNDEEEVETVINMRYPNRKVNKKQDTNQHSGGNGTKMLSEPCYSTMDTH